MVHVFINKGIYLPSEFVFVMNVFILLIYI